MQELLEASGLELNKLYEREYKVASLALLC